MMRVQIRTLLSGFFVLFVLYDILAISTYNNDWDAYEQMYYGTFSSNDIFFQYLIDTANSWGFSYSQFYTIVQSFIYITFIYFCSKFFNKGFSFLLCVLLIVVSPNLSILLRYYLAFSIFLLSIVTYINHNRILTALFLIIAFFTHSAIIICLPVYGLVWYLTKVDNKTIYNRLFLISIIVAAVKLFIIDFLSAIGLNVFSSYSEDVASIPSTIFMDCIYFSWFCTSYYLHNKVQSISSAYKEDRKYIFLYATTVYPILFLLISNIMIVQFRLYEPFIILCLTYMLYVKYKYFNNSPKITIMILLLLLFSLLLKYVILGYLTGGISEWYIHYHEIILSNDRSIILNLI